MHILRGMHTLRFLGFSDLASRFLGFICRSDSRVFRVYISDPALGFLGFSDLALGFLGFICRSDSRVFRVYISV